MTRPNTGELDPKDTARAEMRSYAIGFVASLLLTGGAFAAHLSGLSASWKIALICAAALVQIVVHLRNFLHLSFSGEQSREDLLLVLFSVCLLAIILRNAAALGGTGTAPDTQRLTVLPSIPRARARRLCHP